MYANPEFEDKESQSIQERLNSILQRDPKAEGSDFKLECNKIANELREA